MILTCVIIFGLLIGSFLNVCIYRVPRKLSVCNPARSFCPKCEKQLSVIENIPVFSWLMLLGKCRSCKAAISWKYPLVELLSASAAAASYLRFGLNASSLVIYALTASLIVISFIDFEFKIIPNVISYPGITIGLCLSIVSEYSQVFTLPITSGTLDSLFGILSGAGFFYCVGLFYYLLTKRVGLGGGDIKLMGMTGAILGWQSIAPTIFLGSFCGAFIGIIAMILSGKGRHTEIPFGPWLSLGAILYMFTDIPIFKF